MNKPVVWHVLASEFNSGQANWLKMPTFMLKKVAMGQGFRLAFPEYLSGMPYLAEEISNEVEPGTPIVPEQPPVESKKRAPAQKGRKVKPGPAPVEDAEPIEAEVVEPETEPPVEAAPPVTASAPVPAGIEEPPPPEILADDDQEKIVQHFRKVGVTEEMLAMILESPRGEWTTSHRTYLQGCWFKLTDTDASKKMEVAEFQEQRYSQQSPF